MDAKEAKRLATNARRREDAARMRERRQVAKAERDAAYAAWLEQRARMKALEDAVDMEQVGDNYEVAKAKEDAAWQSKMA